MNVPAVKTKSAIESINAGILIAITSESPVNIGHIIPVNANGINITALIMMKRLNSCAWYDANIAPNNTANGGKHGNIYVTSFESENEKNMNVTQNHNPKNIPSDFEIILHFPNMAMNESHNMPVYGTEPASNIGMKK